MAQSESMLRLIKDDKIVGYEYRLFDISRNDLIHIKPETFAAFLKYGISHVDSFLTAIHGSTYIACDGSLYIRHDLFEMGIKIGDEWYFDGDIFEWKVDTADFGKVINRGILKSPDNMRPWSVSFYSIYDILRMNGTCIGNMHDNPELLKENDHET